MTIGVYRIRNIKNGKLYFGSSKRCERRFNEHRSALNLNRHHCRALQNSWNAHGPDAFRFEIIQVYPTWDDALEAEQSVLWLYIGLHCCFNGSANARMPILDHDVMARARATANTSARYIESHREVCRKRNADQDFQRRATEALRASAKHKAAARQNALLLQRPEIYAKSRKALSESVVQKDAARRQAMRLNADPVVKEKLKRLWIPVVGTSLSDGSQLTFPSQSAAARHFGFYPSTISECCAGRIKSAGGFTWGKACEAVRQLEKEGVA